MALSTTRQLYRAFGLNIASEYTMPELIVAEESSSPIDIDVEIVRGNLTELWEVYKTENGYYTYFDNQFLLHVPEVALFAVQEGRTIIVSPFEGTEERMIRLYLLGTCTGMLLMQRRILPLHGSVVVIDGRGYAFVGESGAGKSTLAAAMRQHGYPLVTDDVIAVSFDPETGGPVVIPAYPQQKLWQSSIDQLEMDASGYHKIYSDKFAIPVTEQFCTSTIPLAGVFELAKTDEEHIELSSYPMLERLAILRLHTFRHFLIERIHAQQWHFTTIVQVASHTPVYRLRRPVDRSTVHELVTLIESTVRLR